MGSFCSKENGSEAVVVHDPTIPTANKHNGGRGTSGGTAGTDDESLRDEPHSYRRGRNANNANNNSGASFRRIRDRLTASTYNDVHQQAAANLNELHRSKSKLIRPVGVVGLTNLGNTCFLNSSLQCLSATIPLTDYFLGYQYKQEINKDNVLGTQGKLVTAYAQWLSDVWSGKRLTIPPRAFKQQLAHFAPQFAGSEQHDAQELLAFLLDGIHEDLNRIHTKPYIEDKDCDGQHDETDAMEAWKNYLRRNKSIIVDIFQGQYRQQLTCLECGYENIRFEPFMYLSLPLTDTCRSVTDCLEWFLAPETLEGDNQWYCTKCKKHVDARKKTDLWILPPILIVHLKRFKFDEYGNVGSKNNAAIAYPIANWNLTPHFHPKRQALLGRDLPHYDLYAVSNHYGGMGGGHYTAYTQTRFDTQEWYECNDSQTHRIPVSTLKQHKQTSAAYVLFYNRTTSTPQQSQQPPKSPSKPQRLERNSPLVRRQSAGRPDLWPHTQVMDHQFREFSRTSIRVLEVNVMEAVPETPNNDTPSANGAIETSLQTTREVPFATSAS